MGGSVVPMVGRRRQTVVAGQPLGFAAGLPGALHGRGLRSAGEQPGAYTAVAAGGFAQSGVGGVGLFFKVYLPLLVPGALSAALLVFVDVLKEMPATLLMRPFGWDTLAVRVFEMTSEGEWARASLPALTLVLVGLLPVIGLIRRSARRPGHRH